MPAFKIVIEPVARGTRAPTPLIESLPNEEQDVFKRYEVIVDDSGTNAQAAVAIGTLIRYLYLFHAGGSASASVAAVKLAVDGEL